MLDEARGVRYSLSGAVTGSAPGTSYQMLMNFRNCVRLLPQAGAVAAFVLACNSIPAFAAERQVLNFNPDWKFIKADPTNAELFAFSDRGWSTVSAPHTYNDVDTFDDFSLPGHRGEQNQWGGRTWYRKSFVVPDAFKTKRIYIEFEGVRQVAQVYLNGKLLGVSKTGFIPFGFDLTPNLRFGATNVLAVMCDNRFMKDPKGREGSTTGEPKTNAPVQPATNDLNINPTPNPRLAQLQNKFNASIPEEIDDLQANQIPWNNPHWHPAHGGIYRNVRLYVVDPLHISLPLYSFLQTAGPYVYASDISSDSARINLEVPIENGRSTGETVELIAQVLDHNGKTVLTLKHEGQVVGGASATFSVSGVLPSPQLWEPDYPCLYEVACSLRSNGEIVDTCKIPLGIRTVKWTADKGLFVNGRHVKLHGWGQKPTDEWPGLGAAQPDWMHFYTLRLMREAGGNWVRWGHCAAGPSLIEACDKLGLMVEQPGLDGESDTVRAAWKLRASGFRDMIIYFRNNPSILIWEGGNQKVTRDHAKELRSYMDKYDPHGGRAYAHRRADQITGEFMDVCIGTEGGHEIKTMPVIEGEYDREESPRRVWDAASPPNFGYPEAKGKSDYVLTSEQFALNEIPQFLRKVGAPSHSGGANWIFSDSTSGGRDAAEVARASGEVDGVRLPKEAYYACAALFRADPQVHILGHWTYPAGTRKTVFVVGNGDEVELFLNSKSLGHGVVSNHFIFAFTNVLWQPGELKAVSWANGRPVATNSLRTAGRPVALKVSPIYSPTGLRADGSDVALFDVEAVDAHGERCPTFQQRVDFDCSGPAIWRGGYNSGKTNSINNTYLDLECGVNRVAIRTTRDRGTVTVRARAKGLRSGSASVKAVAFKAPNGFTATQPYMPEVALPKVRKMLPEPDWAFASRGQKQVPAAKFVREFSYSGPATTVHVEKGARDGGQIYADRDELFAGLPSVLAGADYVQASDADKMYSAVDLMEIAVAPGTTVYVAHDDRLDRPEWLTRQFKATNLSVKIDGQAMKIFAHRSPAAESLTLGSNTESNPAGCNMYVVFVQGAK
jgi:beta-galactosidase